jgi:predicted 3-demethylubiquinone-9 3-methyltransferase (glyoxalase superfamily)
LWFDQAEEAAEFYVGVFKNSRIVKIARYGKAGHETELVSDPDSKRSQRAFEAMLQMKKLDIDKLKKAYAG